ncbi:MAG: bifunctional diaminohydroxyphosphoribosylaminopyrimidine deaminase/5-amino-6-(5-phosphoribosylamino)uracil reductase RibD [Nitrospiraceae bacterium]|nr:MAG: bifunctional diaminohydroxyphosphoribosylaminopyrimidine deaminase/5-amino-6-(5-phosphoribosylamino)uracil reductase RibD [Nitrospiraceae bacterium]
MNDRSYMQMALKLAARGKGRTSPNPMVGAVIVKGDKVIASGHHRMAGTAHAEAAALKKAGPRAEGATLYVNLEPCCHTGKRTPPCTKTIIKAGIKEVVTAMIDPNPRVSGRGLKELRKAGIKTRTGILKDAALKLNEGFIKHITLKRPFVILKIAQSIDGKIATAAGESKWITGPEARERVHELRNEVDALLVGSGTVKADNPSLDCRVSGGRNPFRIIVDSSLKISLNSKVLRYDDGKTLIATTKKADKRKLNSLLKKGIRVLLIKTKSGRVDLNCLMDELGRLDITTVMIEGGSSVAASALADRIVDKAMFFTAPKIIGGVNAIPSVGGKSPALLSEAIMLKDVQVTLLGDDMLIEGYVNYS